MKYFKWIFTFMKPYRVIYGVGMFFYRLQSFATSLLVGMVSMAMMAGILAGDVRQIVTGVLIALGVLIGFQVLVGIGIYLATLAFLRAQMDLKQALFRSFIKTGLETAQATHSGEGIAKINTEANLATSELYWNVIQWILSVVLTFAFSAVTLFILEWRMGLAALGLGLLAFLVQSRFIEPMAKIGREQLDANAEAVKGVSDVFQGAISIRAFNMQEATLKNEDRKVNALRLLDFRQAWVSTFQNLFTTVKGWLAVIITFGFGGWLVYAGYLEFPVLMLALPLFGAVSEEMGGIGRTLAGLQGPLEATKRLYDIVENTPPSLERGKMDFDGEALHLRDLHFQYLNARRNTLKDINLDINKGEMVAFVGHSGSGKSTILRIIVGFYEREQLGMSLGTTSADAVDITAWRQQFAFVDQSCKLFDMSIRENIALGRKGDVTNEDITAAAKQAFAHDFIESLDEKYDTPCGERGASLSGGQKQRIAIARALVKGAPILVFDEATSALDAESEGAVMETIHALRKSHTILITTHNLHNIVTADKIVVMDKGSIAEIGTHDDLMAKGGVYYDLMQS